METLIAFSCYYRADDSRMAGKMEQFYTLALASYKEFKYPDCHAYIARKITTWYKQFPFKNKTDEEEDEAEGAEAEDGDVVEAPPVLANGASGAFTMSPSPGSEDDGGGGEAGAEERENGTEEEAAGEAGAAAAADPAAAAVPAAAAASGP